MKNLQSYLFIIVTFSLLSCVSKKEFVALSDKVDDLTTINDQYINDTDGDGVIDIMDQEPDTPEGCQVDTHGISLDSDEDGVIDCQDMEPFSPPGYNINSNGVSEVPQHNIEEGLTEEDVLRLIMQNRWTTATGSSKKEDCVLVDTYFATDRNLIGEIDHPQLEFGSYRDKVKYGISTISIPLSHKIGEIESPSLWRFEFRENPNKHVMFRYSEIYDKELFFQTMLNKSDKNILLFVHGYNVSFVNAAKRTAQMAYDLDFKGIPMFYSWPSQASLLGYMKDSQNIEYSEPNIKEFIINLITQLPDHDIYIVAHSMGNRGVTKALSSIFKESPDHASSIKEIILTAPDIDAEIFKRDIAPNLVMHGNSVTLYASSTDKALQASKEVNGYPRAGDTGDNIVIVEGIETIDASNVSTGFLGHSYFGEARSIISDINSIIGKHLKAYERFGLKKEISGTGSYWKFKK